MEETTCDVLIVGSGNAGFSAAITASQFLPPSSKILLIDKCPPSWAGGNSYFTAGAFRTVHNGLEDILPLVSNVDAETAKFIDLAPYTNEEFLGDMEKVTHGRYDRQLGKTLVEGSREAIGWLKGLGLDFQLSFNRQAYKVNNRHKFFGGLCLKTINGGAGLIAFHQASAAQHNIQVLYSTAAQSLLTSPQTGLPVSLLASQDGKFLKINFGAVVLAAGGFESSPRLRAQYLGPNWDLAHVRGTPYNTGEVLNLTITSLYAKTAGQWSGCHSVAWDANSPADSGDREISNEFTKSGYPLGVTINVKGERFFDEGGDLRNYTYAKFGRSILAQPNSTAFQVWDQKGVPWLRSEEYREKRTERIFGDTIEELAGRCATKGLEDPKQFVQTVREYNEAVYTHRKEFPNLKWDPAILDGLSTQSSTATLKVPKLNWALPIDQGPFMAVKVGCGVTFTFGGLAVDPKTAGVISNLTGKTIPGVFCAGEMVGGLFYENYPGGSGLTSGTVFGRIAGREAAEFARIKEERGKRIGKEYLDFKATKI